MKMSELIVNIGDENVKFQPLDSCFLSADHHHTAGTKITFGTDQPLLPNGTRDYGIVLWLPRDKVEEALGK